jgi:hypothetical protein
MSYTYLKILIKLDSDKSDAKISSEFDENLNNSRIVKQIKSKEIFENPQFVVTLDGVDHNKFFKNSESKQTFYCSQLFLFD